MSTSVVGSEEGSGLYGRVRSMFKPGSEGDTWVLLRWLGGGFVLEFL